MNRARDARRGLHLIPRYVASRHRLSIPLPTDRQGTLLFRPALHCASAFAVALVAPGRRREENCRLSLALCTTRVITLHLSSCVYALASIRSTGKLARYPWNGFVHPGLCHIDNEARWTTEWSNLYACTHFERSKFFKRYQMKEIEL